MPVCRLGAEWMQPKPVRAKGGGQGSRASGTRCQALRPQSLPGVWGPADKDPGSMGTLALQVSDPSPKVQPARSEACSGNVGPSEARNLAADPQHWGGVWSSF